MDFDMLGLAPRLVSKLEELGITDPTPIQAQAIPHAMNGRDVMGLAQTGTGKTAAFGLPMLDALMSDGGRPSPKTAKALVLAPTRELASGGLGTTGVKPTYLITDRILKQIVNS